MIDILGWALAGVGVGVVAGLLPGIHPNTFIAGMLAILSWLLSIASPVALAIFIVACVIANSFVSFIPSVFIGAPDAETALSVLPGHRLMLEGRGYEAVWLTVAGGIGVIVLSIVFAPLMFVALPVFYQMARLYMFWLLVVIVAVMVWTEGPKRAWGLTVFLLAGLFGLILLNNAVLPSQWLLFPVFTGLFGLPTLIVSMRVGKTIPAQRVDRVRLSKLTGIVGTLKGWLAGMIVGILPSIGPAQAAVVVQETTRRRDAREFLIAVGGITTVSTLFSLLALYLIDKPRSGAAIAVQQILGSFGFGEMAVLMATALFATGVSAMVTLTLTHRFASIIQRVNYRVLNLVIMTGLVCLVGVLTGLIGLVVLGVATAIGLIAPLTGTKRTHLMGVLMMPVMVLYSPV